MNPLDLFEESRLEPRPIVILRKAALVIIYSLLVGYGFVLFFRVIFDHPLLLMSSYKDDKSQIPDVIFTMGTNFMIKCRIANNDFSHATNCDQYLIQPTPTGNAYITLFISESDFYLYHPGQRSQNGSIIFDFYASDAATVNSTAIYTNIYDINSNPFRDGADITTNISLAAQRLGGEGLHVYTLGKHQIGLYYYSRTIRKALKHPILAALGFELQYVDRPRLDTLWSSRERNMSTITNSDYFGTVQVSCNNFFVHTETEQRSYTLLALFGLLGGVWSTLRGLYNYLFGTDQQQGAVYSWYSWWFRNQEPLYDTLES